jgi:predicted dehydrogenase
MADKHTVRVGFVGAGFSAGLHASGLREVTGVPVALAAVSAGDPANARAFAGRHGIPVVHDDWRDLVRDPDVDVVCICVPNALHEEVAIAAARAGKHIICEKPLSGAFGASELRGTRRADDELARAIESAARIERAVAEAGVLFLYAENWIYAPAIVKVKRLIRLASSSILDIRAEESHSGSHAVRSRRRETAGGGALLMLGSHPIAAALHLKAFEGSLEGRSAARPVSVVADCAAFYEAQAARQVTHPFIVADWKDVETWANVVIAFSDGSRATVTASFAMLGGVRNSMDVYTTNAVYRANMTPNDSLMVYTPDAEAFGDEYLHEKIESRTGWMSVSPDEDWVRGYPQEMQDFMECVSSQRQPVSDLQLAKDVLGVVYAAYSSAERGERVLIPTF